MSYSTSAFAILGYTDVRLEEVVAEVKKYDENTGEPYMTRHGTGDYEVYIEGEPIGIAQPDKWDELKLPIGDMNLIRYGPYGDLWAYGKVISNGVAAEDHDGCSAEIKETRTTFQDSRLTKPGLHILAYGG